MAQIDWQSIMNGQSQPRKRYQGANVKFFNAVNENRIKSLAAGRPIFDEIPSISIQWPGGDETVRKIEPQDMQDYPDLYAAFTAGNQPVESGTPLQEWPPMTASAMRELHYLGFRTVEQLAEANDEIRRKIGPLSKFVKLAKDWLDAANSSQNDVSKLRQQLEQETKLRQSLAEKIELLLQRIEANEGTDLRSYRKEVIPSQLAPVATVEEDLSEDLDLKPARRGRPRKA
jgi:hypothetical protein